MERKNKKTKSVGNGEGSLYYSETLKCWIFQYVYNGKRKTLKQRKNEQSREFKKRVTSLKNSINTGTYIEKSTKTIISIAEQYIENKRNSGITSPRTYRRNLETIEQIKKTCKNFCYMPIQKVTIDNIEDAKSEIKKYSNSVIDKIWELLKKVFSIAASPSRRLIPFNIMLDENLVKPLSDKKTKKVFPLSEEEVTKLIYILDNEEKDSQYKNIIKMQVYSGMRIGEVLSRSTDDFNKINMTLNIHNTLTQDEKYNIILGEHTKTFNKKTQIDKGQRYLPLDNILFKNLLVVVEEETNKKITNLKKLLFWDYKNNTFINPSSVNSWLNRINKKYKICKENLSTHRLRHTALTYWKEIGIPQVVIQYLAGHMEDSNVTDNYIDVSFDFIAQELKKIK